MPMAKLLCLFLLCAAGALAQVEGSVFDAATGAGIPNVKVELLKGGTPFYETSTDGGGRFRFDNVREGDYAARYQSPDYWLTAGPSDYRYFHVAADPLKLEVRLMPWSRIAGRVVDGRGHGIANVQVEISGSGMLINGRTYLRTSWGGGGGGALTDFPMHMNHRGHTDAEGRFEVQLMPGAYGLDALVPPDLAPPPPEPDGPALAWTRTWYPGVARAEGASKIVVLPGERATVELKLLAVPMRAVRGVVLRPDGTPAPKVPVVIGELSRPVTVESRADGTFEFGAVAEGEWRIQAEVAAGAMKLRAVDWIEVGRHDLEDVKLRLARPLTVRAKMVIDAPQNAPPFRPTPMFLALVGGPTTNDDLGPGRAALAIPAAGGEFTFEDVYPGTYHLARQLQPPPAPYYLDAVLLGGADATRQGVELSSDATITVVYKTDGGSVTGKAEHCASGGVLLVPADPTRRGPGFSGSGACDAADRYEVRAVRPGDYYVLAFAGNGPVVPVDEALLNQAVKVTVRSGETSAADLRAVTRPIY